MQSTGSGDRRRHDRRLAIIEAATLVFSELGYHNASISDVIRRAAIARGTFYLYFSNKRSVFDAILDGALKALSSRIHPLKLGHSADAPERQLRAMLIDILEFLSSERALAQLLLNHGLTPDSESAERVEAFMRHVEGMIQRSLEMGCRAGLVRPCPTAWTAAGLLGLMRGVVVRLLNDTTADIAGAADEIIALSTHGVLLRQP